MISRLIKSGLGIGLCFLTVMPVFSQSYKELALYPQGALTSNGITEAEYLKGRHVYAVSETVLYAFLPDKNKATGQAVVIFPGGGYRFISIVSEGFQVADWLVSQGIAAIVVKYRLPNGHHNIPLDDARAAMKLVRSKASAWNVDPGKVGVMGFSAGGHLAATLSTRYDEGSRPDFSILVYPNISLISPYARGNAKEVLFGKNGGNEELYHLYSAELQVTGNTPPAFIVLSDDDPVVNPDHSLRYYRALKTHQVPAEMHIFAGGKHGWGFQSQFEYLGELKTLLGRWLTKNNVSK